MNTSITTLNAKQRSRTSCRSGKARSRFWVVCMVWVALLLAGCQPMGYSDDNELFAESTVVEMEPIEVAPDFALVTLDGATVRLSELRGRWVLINFWATWCAPCRDEMPYLDRLAATHPNRLTVLAVNMRERATEVAFFADTLNLRLPILLAPDDATLLAYNVRGLPISILVAPRGTIALRIAGPLTTGVIETIIAEN